MAQTILNKKYLVTYRSRKFRVYVDFAGLDIEAVGETDFSDRVYERTAHELFCKVVDLYPTLGLRRALTKAGAKFGKAR